MSELAWMTTMIDHLEPEELAIQLAMARERLSGVYGYNPAAQAAMKFSIYREGLLNQALKIKLGLEPRKFGPVTYGLGGSALAAFSEEQAWLDEYIMADYEPPEYEEPYDGF